MRVGFVVQRYGVDFAGGAEHLARQVAELMASRWDITVFTTCAKDYRTWENVYAPGETVLNGVKVRRFPVLKTREWDKFSQESSGFESRAFRLSAEEEQRFFDEQGPLAPELVTALKTSYGEIDAFIFFTYLYYPTVMGLPEVAAKAFLVPTAHDEPPFYFVRSIAPLFHSLKGVLFLTREEQELVNRVYRLPHHVSQAVIGYGVPLMKSATPEHEKEMEKKFAKVLDVPYILYVGRVCQGKGCPDLIHQYALMQGRYKMWSRLLLVGGVEIDLPKEREDVVALGFVSDDEKAFLLRRSMALINPSRHESLSIVILEAWQQAVPVVVNGACAVTKALCDRSQGGLYYHSNPMFQGILAWLFQSQDVARHMAIEGQKFVRRYFNMDDFRQKIIAAVEGKQ